MNAFSRKFNFKQIRQPLCCNLLCIRIRKVDRYRHSRPINSFLRTPPYVGWNLQIIKLFQYRPTLISTNKIKRIDPCLLSEENSFHSMVRVRNVLKLASLSLGSGVSDLSPANYATGIPRRFLSHICAGEASWILGYSLVGSSVFEATLL